VEEVIDDAGADEEVSCGVVVAAPGIAGAIGEDFEFPFGLFVTADRTCAADPRVKLEPLVLRLAGAADFAVGEDAVGHVKPAVGAPGEAVDELMRVLAAKAGEHDTPGVWFVIAIVIAEVDEVRLLADVDAVVATKDGAGEIEAFDEDGALVCFAIVVGVFEDDDAIAWDLVAGFRQRVVLIILRLAAKGGRVWRAFGILVSLHDPQAAAMIPSHGDGVLNHRLMRKAADLVALGDAHLRTGFFGRWAGGLSGFALALDLLAC